MIPLIMFAMRTSFNIELRPTLLLGCIGFAQLATSSLESLISIYENKLLDALTFEKWEDAHYLVNSIQCIKDVKNGVSPQWGENPYKSEIKEELSDKTSVANIPIELVLSATKISTYDR